MAAGAGAPLQRMAITTTTKRATSRCILPGAAAADSAIMATKKKKKKMTTTTTTETSTMTTMQYTTRSLIMRRDGDGAQAIRRPITTVTRTPEATPQIPTVRSARQTQVASGRD